MAQLGVGAMIGMLGGNEETVNAHNQAKGRKIVSAKVDEATREDGALILSFDGGSRLTVWDGGRSCCESRYITCDDNLDDLAGEFLKEIVLKEGPEEQSELGEPHEQMFVEVLCESGANITLTTHNEHNGYYGGFYPRCQFDAPA